MGTIRQDRIAQLRWEMERKEKRSLLEPKLMAIIEIDSFAFLTDKESDEFQLKSDDWPQNKWDDKLFVQAEILDTKPIEGIIIEMMNVIEEEHLYIFMMNFNFGLIRISKTELIKYWRELIEIDGDEIYCYNPSSSGFICIEKTEEFISGIEGESSWIYELTFSNKELKDELYTAQNNI
ncbi:hypothetical protein [Algoriphagus resistens]|uniref:hypothetical protein n=1 Tax=Algoriphagus resistens TaxID=1750590 RepID=UPI00071696AC|nr:hypothetical protein [Algoriphagus resistens]